MEYDEIEIFFRSALSTLISLPDEFAFDNIPVDIDSIDHDSAYHRLFRECRLFVRTARDNGWLDDDSDYEQAGCDYILSRNGEGSGFWDRASVYGTAAANAMQRVCECMVPLVIYLRDHDDKGNYWFRITEG